MAKYHVDRDTDMYKMWRTSLITDYWTKPAKQANDDPEELLTEIEYIQN